MTDYLEKTKPEIVHKSREHSSYHDGLLFVNTFEKQRFFTRQRWNPKNRDGVHNSGNAFPGA